MLLDMLEGTCLTIPRIWRRTKPTKSTAIDIGNNSQFLFFIISVSHGRDKQFIVSPLTIGKETHPLSDRCLGVLFSPSHRSFGYIRWLPFSRNGHSRFTIVPVLVFCVSSNYQKKKPTNQINLLYHVFNESSYEHIAHRCHDGTSIGTHLRQS